MGLRGRLEGVLNFIKEENLESSLIRKGFVSGLLMSTLALTLLTTSSVIGEESKVYAKSNGKDSNILMRVDTKNGTEELKEKFEKQIQDIEEESSKKQNEPKSVEEMIMEQPDLLNDVQFIQNNYNVVTQIVYSQPSFLQYISNANALTASGGVYYGPNGKETYYNLNMSGVIDIMRGMGNNDAYWIREDGAKMLGDYVIVAADLNKYPRGTIVETSLGKGNRLRYWKFYAKFRYSIRYCDRLVIYMSKKVEVLLLFLYSIKKWHPKMPNLCFFWVY